MGKSEIQSLRKSIRRNHTATGGSTQMLLETCRIEALQDLADNVGRIATVLEAQAQDDGTLDPPEGWSRCNTQ